MRARHVILVSAICCAAASYQLREHRLTADHVSRDRQSAARENHQISRAQPPWKQFNHWAARDPRAALLWLGTRDRITQSAHAEAGWREAVKKPEHAILIAREIIHSLPPNIAELHGHWLVLSLAEADMADHAMAFALSIPANISSEWPRTILAKEAERNLESAAALWQQMPAGDQKQSAWTPLMTMWAARDSAGLCAYALELPLNSPERAESLREGTRAWCMNDPQAYTEWLNTIESHEDFDNGLALLVTGSDSLFCSTTDALGWTESINDPNLRLACATHVLKKWAVAHPEQARNWIDDATWLAENERENLLQISFHPEFLPAD